MSAPSSVERQLDGRERGRDVEDVEPADVADAEDLALQVLLAGRERDAVPVAEVQQQLVASRCPSGARIAVTTAAVSSSGEKSSSPIALTPARAARPSRTCRSNACLEPVVEDQAERDVEAADQRDGRRERRVERVLRLLVRCASRSRSCATVSRARARAPARTPSRARAGTSAPSASRRRRRRSPRRRSRAARRRATRSRRRRAARRRPPA